jgi:hypothetical protein
MRVNLKVPYAEKDKAKRLGAKWDMARKVWFVEDLDNLSPFLRWMPEHLKRPVKTESKAVKKSQEVKALDKNKPKKACNRINKVTPRTDFSLLDTGCSCVPWEWCEHNPG